MIRRGPNLQRNVLSPAAEAFDAIAPAFDERYGSWLSVSAQRNAVREYMHHVFTPGASLLEVGAGTGEDALWMTKAGYRVHLTDASPTMVELARRKLGDAVKADVVAAEQLSEWQTPTMFDGAYSNFAALNCVADLSGVAHGLAQHLKPGASAIVVMFGPLTPGEWVTELLRGRPRAMFRRFKTQHAPARLGGRDFTISYHRPGAVETSFAPWFELRARRGVGVFVPPSAAEPWISEHPRLLEALVRVDRVASRPLALLGDHLLYHFVRRHE